jgi:hypothetical protein
VQCSYCSRPINVGHICPYCKEYHCKEHNQPASHRCTSNVQANLPSINDHCTPKTRVRSQTALTGIESIQSRFFLTVFTLVIVEEILRLVSYAFRSPYLESNVYVALTSLQVTPYFSSSILFLLVCLILLATRKLAGGQNTKKDYASLLKKTLLFGMYISIAMITLVSIANRLVILLA